MAYANRSGNINVKINVAQEIKLSYCQFNVLELMQFLMNYRKRLYL